MTKEQVTENDALNDALKEELRIVREVDEETICKVMVLKESYKKERDQYKLSCASLWKNIDHLTSTVKPLFDACGELIDVLTEPGIMDVDLWKDSRKKAIHSARAAIAKAQMCLGS